MLSLEFVLQILGETSRPFKLRNQTHEILRFAQDDSRLVSVLLLNVCVITQLWTRSPDPVDMLISFLTRILRKINWPNFSY